MGKKYVPKKLLAIVLSAAMIGGLIPVNSQLSLTAYAQEPEIQTEENLDNENLSEENSDKENSDKENSDKEDSDKESKEDESEASEATMEQTESSEETSEKETVTDESTVEETTEKLAEETTEEELTEETTEIEATEDETTEEETTKEAVAEESGEDIIEVAEDTQTTTARAFNFNINGTIAGINNPTAVGTSSDKWAKGKGSYIYYGNYYQTEDITVKSPVKYRVLDNNNASNSSGSADSILLMADASMDAIVYSETSYGLTGDNAWSDSIAKKWLNSEEFDSSATSGTYTSGGVSKQCI
jgi:chemotaxis protein histidine kinase CheA